MKKLLFLLVFIVSISLSSFSSSCFAQNVGIGTTSPNDKAILHVHSTTKGVLLPNLNKSERDLIKNPPHGLHIFNTDDNCLNYYDTSLKAWNCYCEDCRIAKDVTIPMDINSWNAYSFNTSGLVAPGSATYFNTAEGVKFIGQGVRRGTRLQTKTEYKFKDKTLYFKWKGSGGGQFAAYVVQVKYDPMSNDGVTVNQGVDLTNFSSSNSFNGSVVIQDGAWYYTTVRAIAGTDNYEVTTATGNYGNKGGVTVQSNTVPIYTKSGYLAIRIGDNYAGSNSYVVLGECKIANN